MGQSVSMGSMLGEQFLVAPVGIAGMGPMTLRDLAQTLRGVGYPLAWVLALTDQLLDAECARRDALLAQLDARQYQPGMWDARRARRDARSARVWTHTQARYARRRQAALAACGWKRQTDTLRAVLAALCLPRGPQPTVRLWNDFVMLIHYSDAEHPVVLVTLPEHTHAADVVAEYLIARCGFLGTVVVITPTTDLHAWAVSWGVPALAQDRWRQHWPGQPLIHTALLKHARQHGLHADLLLPYNANHPKYRYMHGPALAWRDHELSSAMGVPQQVEEIVRGLPLQGTLLCDHLA